VGVEVVQHQHDRLRGWVVHVDQLLDRGRPVQTRLPGADVHKAPAAQRLGDHKEGGHAPAHVLEVLPRRDAGRWGQGRRDLPQQLAAGLIQPDHGPRRGVGAGVDIQHIFPMVDDGFDIFVLLAEED
jgi:hypothetical protein